MGGTKCGAMRCNEMDKLILVFIVAIFMVGALWAGSGMMGRPRHFKDKDADGAPDEPNGPAKDL